MEKYESILIKNGILLTMQGEGVGSIIDGAVAIEGEDIIAVERRLTWRRNTEARSW